MTGGLKMGVNVAAHTRHMFLGSAPPGGTLQFKLILSLVFDVPSISRKSAAAKSPFRCTASQICYNL